MKSREKLKKYYLFVNINCNVLKIKQLKPGEVFKLGKVDNRKSLNIRQD